MSSWRQVWLVARREIRERSRTRAFRASLVLMVAAVVAVVALPGLFQSGSSTKAVGVTGPAPVSFTATLVAQGQAAGTSVDVRELPTLSTAQAALRDRRVDVLVVDARRLEWRDRAEPSLQSLVTTALQVSVVRQRAAAAGVGPATTARLLAPIPVSNVVIGTVAGGNPDDRAAAALMTVALLTAIVVYGNLVLTGVAEEKASRVVEVLLTRIPARALLAGKVVGIGLLGLFQFAITALAALLATIPTGSVDLPAVTGGVLAWVVVWFILGFALYAMLYGALGSLASRTEDAQNVAGPLSYVLLAGYWACLFAVGENPDGIWSRTLSLFPATAPLAMPGRIALGATSWWEPALAVAITVATIAVLVGLAGRVYSNAILHTGPTLKLREAWGGSSGDRTGHAGPRLTAVLSAPRAARTMAATTIVLGIVATTAVYAVTRDVVWSLVPTLLAIAAARGLLRRN